MQTIPAIDVGPLFGPETADRRDADTAVFDAARRSGFMTAVGLPDDTPLGRDARNELFRLFSLPEAELRPLWRKASAPENDNVYRGFFPIASGIIKHGIDIGPSRAAGGTPGDALAEATPLPPESTFPGWAHAMRRSFSSLERAGHVLLHALARGLGLPESFFDPAFQAGNSTLRLIEYPPWPERARAHGLALRPIETPDGRRRYDIGGEHVDSGFVTLLQQDEVGGLQVCGAQGAWLDVPPRDDALVVNFGKLLERWTEGRIRATSHRVLGNDVARRSIPFFYEPRIDARIGPLPLAWAKPFEPFVYGDHLWEAMTEFAEFHDLERWPSRER